jgi:general secretion pathway protein A
MYTQFYGLREKPFSLSPDPRYLYLSDAHREALAHLLYGIEQGEGFIAITGEVGTGKTTLCRTLLQRIEPGTEVAFIFNPQLSGLELLQTITAELGLPTEGRTRRELTEQLNRFLLAKRQEGRRVLLIVDEAQTLERDALEQVRLLSNLETDTQKLIQIILIGQPELDTILESPELRQLRQRISVRWRLTPLSASETREYVRHRLRIAAGAPRELFTELALRELHRRSGGIPRLINLLCDRALLAGYASSATSIGLGLGTQTEQELRAGARGRPAGDAAEQLARRRFGQQHWVPAAAALGIALLVGLLWLGIGRGDPAVAPGDGNASRGAQAPQAVAPADVAAEPRASLAVPVGRAAPAAAEAEAHGAGAEPEGHRPAEPEVAAAAEAPSAAPPAAHTGPAAETLEPAPPADLGTALARHSPAATTAATLDALLLAWGSSPTRAELLSPEQAAAVLRGQGLLLLPLRAADRAALRFFDQPAILVLRAFDGASRWALLRALGPGGEAILEGLGEGPWKLPFEAVEPYWDGEAFVAWKDFEQLPDVLRPGSRGASVTWLQDTLAQLGHYVGPTTGEFDGPTIAAVRSLQDATQVQVDGTVGPLTKIRIYQALRDYGVPRLRAGRSDAS